MQDLPPETVEKLARVTKLLKTQRTLPAKLEAVVALVKRTIPNCDAAGICLLIDGEPTSIAVSDRLAIEIDLVQYRTGDGPCLTALVAPRPSGSTSWSGIPGSPISPQEPSTST